MQNIRYCRLKHLTIGYTLPKNWTRNVLLDNLRVYFTGENLATCLLYTSRTSANRCRSSSTATARSANASPSRSACSPAARWARA